MINVTDLKNGTTFLHFGKPCQVIKYNLIKLGRGSACVKVTARNLQSGGIEEISYQSNASVEEALTLKKKLQYLYKDAANAVFMDPLTFDQTEIPLRVLGEQINYLQEGDEVEVLFLSEQPLTVKLPPKVVLTVKQTDPGAKGNSATNVYKPAVLENGLKIKVPLFIKVGDKIRIDTRSGDYIERVK